jgi:glutamate dehydrogenase
MEQEKLFTELRGSLRETVKRAEKNLVWLRKHMHPFFFITMQDEKRALVTLASVLAVLRAGKRVVLDEEENRISLASLSEPGSFFDALRTVGERGIFLAELHHSLQAVPGADRLLEVLRFEFSSDILPGSGRGLSPLPKEKSLLVKAFMKRRYPSYESRHLEEDLALLIENNRRYAEISSPERIGRVLWLYRQGKVHEGLFLDAEEDVDSSFLRESRVLFSVRNPPERGFLAQAMEVFRRLGIGVHRAYCLAMTDGKGSSFLGTFYVKTGKGKLLERDSKSFRTLKTELYNTQILSTTSRPYREHVLAGTMTGQEASLTNAFIGFCYTTLAHRHPDRYHLSEVVAAFTVNPEQTLRLCRLFLARFDPKLEKGEKAWPAALDKAEAAIAGYNTGHRHLDEVRRTIYRTALLFIRHTLKTNFFVPEKHALAFRLDPRYLDDLGDSFTGDLPSGKPFRITFFSGRHGLGYHVGFADIARGGWRTVICGDEDDYNENAETLFREVYVLAHTQHLKNKDIYEGGSKMVTLLDNSDVRDGLHRRQRLHNLQYGFISAFFDIFALKGGQPCHPMVVDYYGEEEAIELGPDENLHVDMIERIARQAEKRRYILGSGVISSKKQGINHKEYGVTSLGVVTFASAALKELGIDMERDVFSLKMTGGPKGDVAGNTIRFLLERCRRIRVRLIIDGSGLLFDPVGADRSELRRLLFKESIDGFSPKRIHDGGFLLSRRKRKKVGMQELFLKESRSARGVRKEWLSADEMQMELEGLLYSVAADLFIPAGGRPETVDDSTWQRFLGEDDIPTCRSVIEGANSFFTEGARKGLQEKGVILIRDVSANKCGVIASSYEIIANLLMSEEEYFDCKEEYVSDVMKILELRAEDEARIIFERHRESAGSVSWTSISENLSEEINREYFRLFDFFQERVDVLSQPALRRTLLSHLPQCIALDSRYRRRINRLPVKYRCAMAASEISRQVVYQGGWEEDLEKKVTAFVRGISPGR